MIFITGATGLIGYHLTQRLADQGHALRLLIRSKDQKKFFLHWDSFSSLQFVVGDVLDVDLIYKSLNGVDTILHAAAIVSFNKADNERMYKVNVEGTANLVNAALAKDIKKFFYLSSIAAFGRHDANTSINENTKWKDSDWNSDYGISKYWSELEVWRGVEEGLNAVILNPSIVMGKNLSWKRSSAGIVPLLFKNSKYYLNGGFNYVDLRDLGDIFICLFKSFEKNKNQRFLINNQSVDNEELATTFNKINNRKHALVAVNTPLVNLFLAYQSVKSLLTGKKSMISKQSIKALRFKANYDNSKVKEACKIEFRSLDDTLQWLSQMYVDKI